MEIVQSPSGRVMRMETGYKAFIPHPLPPHFDWDNALVYSLSRADFLLGKLAREGSRLPNPHLLIICRLPIAPLNGAYKSWK